MKKTHDPILAGKQIQTYTVDWKMYFLLDFESGHSSLVSDLKTPTTYWRKNNRNKKLIAEDFSRQKKDISNLSDPDTEWKLTKVIVS